MRKIAVSGLVVVLLTVTCAMCTSVTNAASSSDDVYGGDFLVDYGNGITKWIEVKGGSDYSEVVLNSLVGAGIGCLYDPSATYEFTIGGRNHTTIGSTDTGGSYTSPGTTGYTETSYWHVFFWDSSESPSKWTEVEDFTEASSGGPIAVAFYPDGEDPKVPVVPVETPEWKSSWTMDAADAENSFNQTCNVSSGDAKYLWSKTNSDPGDAKSPSGSYTSVLFAGGYAFVKNGYAATERNSAVVCYSVESGNMVWRFVFERTVYDMAGFLIVGQNIYIPSSEGTIYKFDWSLGPGENRENVTEADHIDDDTEHPPEKEPSYGQGPSTLVYDSGAIFLKHRNGMAYCFDLDLNLLWSYQMNGGSDKTQPTIMDDYYVAGSSDGVLYVLNKTDGTLVVSIKSPGSSANVPSFIGTERGYKIFVSYDDGSYNPTSYGVAVYNFDVSSKQISLWKDLGKSIGCPSSYMTRFVTDEFKGVMISTDDGLFSIDADGNVKLMSNVVRDDYGTHAAPTFVNGSVIYISSYDYGQLFTLDVNGNVTGNDEAVIKQNSMAPLSIVDGYYFWANDAGFMAYSSGALPAYVAPSATAGTALWVVLLIVLACIIVALSVLWVFLRFVKKWEHPFADLKDHLYTYLYGENYSHNSRSKHRLLFTLTIGLIFTFVICIFSLCIGSDTTVGPGEALSALGSAMSKGGHGLTRIEYLIYVDRMPRTMAALGAGIGLSIAGAMYQAVIKNPLVEPYIMGVSSGAGTLAIAVLTFDFTLFGLMTSDNPFLVAVCAIIGGLGAFGCTMFLAEKTGGKSVNYVLSGIVVGLVFSAVQSLMIVSAGNKITSALGWLYGSFTSITWEEAWLVLIPCLALSLVPFVWAKEFNLVLLGEDQAKQMGLDAKKFDMIMLVLASVLTAFCVAFCGVIGFVGLVVPHVSRMILGGDHRLMLPLTIILGGSLMVIADLAARVLVSGYELPVGAITAFIGVPVFAYLLIKRGGAYDA